MSCFRKLGHATYFAVLLVTLALGPHWLGLAHAQELQDPPTTKILGIAYEVQCLNPEFVSRANIVPLQAMTDFTSGSALEEALDLYEEQQASVVVTDDNIKFYVQDATGCTSEINFSRSKADRIIAGFVAEMKYMYGEKIWETILYNLGYVGMGAGGAVGFYLLSAGGLGGVAFVISVVLVGAFLLYNYLTLRNLKRANRYEDIGRHIFRELNAMLFAAGSAIAMTKSGAAKAIGNKLMGWQRLTPVQRKMISNPKDAYNTGIDPKLRKSLLGPQHFGPEGTPYSKPSKISIDPLQGRSPNNFGPKPAASTGASQTNVLTLPKAPTKVSTHAMHASNSLGQNKSIATSSLISKQARSKHHIPFSIATDLSPKEKERAVEIIKQYAKEENKTLLQKAIEGDRSLAVLSRLKVLARLCKTSEKIHREICLLVNQILFGGVSEIRVTPTKDFDDFLIPESSDFYIEFIKALSQAEDSDAVSHIYQEFKQRNIPNTIFEKGHTKVVVDTGAGTLLTLSFFKSSEGIFRGHEQLAKEKTLRAIIRDHGYAAGAFSSDIKVVKLPNGDLFAFAFQKKIQGVLGKKMLQALPHNLRARAYALERFFYTSMRNELRNATRLNDLHNENWLYQGNIATLERRLAEIPSQEKWAHYDESFASQLFAKGIKRDRLSYFILSVQQAYLTGNTRSLWKNKRDFCTSDCDLKEIVQFVIDTYPWLENAKALIQSLKEDAVWIDLAGPLW